MHVKLNDVENTPLLSYSLNSLPSLALKGRTYAGDKDGVSLKLKGGETVHFPLVGKLCCQYGYHSQAKGRVVDTAYVVITPGQAKAPTTPTNINTFHCTLEPHTRGAAQENGGVARSQPQRGTLRVPGVFNGKEATAVHRQVDAHQSRYPLPPPRPHSNCLILTKRGSLQRGKARAGRARQIKAEGGWTTWTASPTSTT